MLFVEGSVHPALIGECVIIPLSKRFARQGRKQKIGQQWVSIGRQKCSCPSVHFIEIRTDDSAAADGAYGIVNREVAGMPRIRVISKLGNFSRWYNRCSVVWHYDLLWMVIGFDKASEQQLGSLPQS
ncbi:hypothetical protein RCCGE510_03033 [Rhizobium sp. CCGE 510]|nr:hypothetical protein RCCGE510_03033 [Rhizobium sp. CCGE 510]